MITNRCNLKCKHCIRSFTTECDFISKEYFEIANKRILEYGKCNAIFVTGGEPTIHQEFSQIISRLNQLSIQRLCICTNGTTPFFSTNNIPLIQSFPKLIWQISLDGNADMHNIIRGENTFSKAMSTIKMLRAINLRVDISTVVNNTNIDSIFNLYQLIKDVGIARWLISPEMPFGKSRDEYQIDCVRWNCFVDDILNTCDIKIRIPKLYDIHLLNKLSAEQIKELSCSSIPHCGSGKKKIYITPDLKVYPCTCLPQYSIGNLKNDSIESITSSPLCQYIIDHPMLEESPCNSCKFYPFCKGGCLGMSFHTFGKINVGDSRCPIFKQGLHDISGITK